MDDSSNHHLGYIKPQLDTEKNAINKININTFTPLLSGFFIWGGVFLSVSRVQRIFPKVFLEFANG